MLTHFQISQAHDTLKTRHRRWGQCRKIFMTAEKQRVLYCDLFTDSCRFCVDSVNLKREGEGVRGFLSYALNAQEYPVSVLETPIESETRKVVENFYRATILAFLHE